MLFSKMSTSSLFATGLLFTSLFCQIVTATPVPRSLSQRDDGDDSDSSDDSSSDDDEQSTSVSAMLTVNTEDALTWCRGYADEMGEIVTYYYEPTPINVQCWATSTMTDDKGSVQGDNVYLKQDNGCWISEVFVQGEDYDFQSDLNQCDAPAHQVAAPKLSAYVPDEGVPCYSGTETSSGKQFLSFGYLELGCSTTGQSVNGNSTWIKSLNKACYLPGDSLATADFHGVSVGKC